MITNVFNNVAVPSVDGPALRLFTFERSTHKDPASERSMAACFQNIDVHKLLHIDINDIEKVNLIAH